MIVPAPSRGPGYFKRNTRERRRICCRREKLRGGIYRRAVKIERINGEIEKDAALSLKDLRIKGDDLIREKIINPSPLMGRILNTLLDEVIEDPTLNEREILLKRATELAREL